MKYLILQGITIGIIIWLVCWINFIDNRLYSFESYFFAPYDSDYYASKLAIEHMSPSAKERVKLLRKYKKKQ